MEKEKLQTCGLFYTFKKKCQFSETRLKVAGIRKFITPAVLCLGPEKQEPRQNSAHKQFLRGSACGKVGEQAGQVWAGGEGVREGWLTVCWQPHSPFRGLPYASAVSSSLLTAACDAWDLSESSRCFWSPALVLGQSLLFPWLSLLLEHWPKCPLQCRLEEGLDCQCRPLAFLMLENQASYEPKQ